MRIYKFQRKVQKAPFFFAIGLMVMFSLSSCAKKISFLTSSITPAAIGYVTMKRDFNENYIIKLSIDNLADVSRLPENKSNYVLWMETDQGNTQNLGQLKSSKNLKATVEVVSSYRPARIFITAEENSSVQYPSGEVVLTTSKF